MEPVKSGVRRVNESWVSWWLFPRLTEDQAEEFIQDNNLTACHLAPGSRFWRDADVRHTKTRTLISQSGGWDV